MLITSYLTPLIKHTPPLMDCEHLSGQHTLKITGVSGTVGHERAPRRLRYEQVIRRTFWTLHFSHKCFETTGVFETKYSYHWTRGFYVLLIFRLHVLFKIIKWHHSCGWRKKRTHQSRQTVRLSEREIQLPPCFLASLTTGVWLEHILLLARSAGLHMPQNNTRGI